MGKSAPISSRPRKALEKAPSIVSNKKRPADDVFETKAKKAEGYTLGTLPLWLLIVCESLDDGDAASGDLASHIFPRNEAEQGQLTDVLRRTADECDLLAAMRLDQVAHRIVHPLPLVHQDARRACGLEEGAHLHDHAGEVGEVVSKDDRADGHGAGDPGGGKP